MKEAQDLADRQSADTMLFIAIVAGIAFLFISLLISGGFV